jgi:hypothetical protein
VGGQRYAPASLPPGYTRYPLYTNRKLFIYQVEPEIRNRVGLSAVWDVYERGLCPKDTGVIIIFGAKRPKDDPLYKSTVILRHVGVTLPSDTAQYHVRHEIFTDVVVRSVGSCGRTVVLYAGFCVRAVFTVTSLRF